MADPLTVTLSLDSIDRSYPVFEADQVLTHEHLNGVTRYLDDQSRLTRVALLGVGVIGGLYPGVASGSVSLSRGVGVTTDGDLLLVASDTLFDRFKPYDETSPRYAPFQAGTATRPLLELVQAGTEDANALPLSQFTGDLRAMVAILFMESHEVDHDLCTGTDCDSIGRDCRNTQRLLLAQPSDANAIAATVAAAGLGAARLPSLSPDRPVLGGPLSTAASLAAPYVEAAKSTHAALVAAFPSLQATVPAFTSGLFGGDPSPAWIAALNAARASFTIARPGVQYYHAFLTDLVEAWNALRDALCDDDSVLVPSVAAFPKHLLLGTVGDPSQFRTPCLPSPLASRGGDSVGRARFAARRLHALVSSFAVPATSPAPEVRVTPSRGSLHPLEERAIPYYYAPSGGASLAATWSWTRARRAATGTITGYHAREFGGDAAAQAPLTRTTGHCDFFRIEGHLGQRVDAVLASLEKTIAAHNLPIAARAVLVHADPTRIKIKPPVRYTDLHRLHRLVRAEVQSGLTRSNLFGTEYRNRIKSAAASGEIASDGARLAKADAYASAIGAAANKAQSALAKRTYSAFRADTSWVAEHETTIKAAAGFKQDFGDVSRTDVATAFDAVVIDNHRTWLDWIDTLIEDRDSKADRRLLLANFVKEHPGVEHVGGAPRGGTFILVYDDSGTIVADLALPYRAVEEIETETDEPELTYTPPPLVKEGLSILKPIPLQFEALKSDIRGEWTKEIDLQKSYLSFFQKNIDIIQSAKVIKSDALSDRASSVATIKDPMARYHAENVVVASERVDRVRQLLQDPEVAPDARERLQKELETAEKDVATRVSEATDFVAKSSLDLSKGGSGEVTLKVISDGIGTVSNAEVRKSMGLALKTTLDSTPQAPNKAAIGNVMKSNNFRL